VFDWILEDNDRKDLITYYKEYQKTNPAKITIDTMLVREEKIPYYNYQNFVAGTSFGTSTLQFSLDSYQSYYRENSFGQWQKAYAIFAARILLSK